MKGSDFQVAILLSHYWIQQRLVDMGHLEESKLESWLYDCVKGFVTEFRREGMVRMSSQVILSWKMRGMQKLS